MTLKNDKSAKDSVAKQMEILREWLVDELVNNRARNSALLKLDELSRAIAVCSWKEDQ